MRFTPSLYVRNLLASIHPPLPRSARESKQLLNVLEKAFQTHLDETHPSPKDLESNDSTSGSDSIPDPARGLARSTDSHLDSILSHPLLRRKSTTFVPSHSLAASAVATFDAALIGKGLDSHLVQFCALQYLEGLEKKETVSTDGRLGPRLANWFTSMDKSSKKDFLVNNKSLRGLISVMYSDGQEAEVWEWLRVLYEREFDNSTFLLSSRDIGDAKAYLQAEDRIVASMMSETMSRRSLQEAAQQYVQACEYRSKRGRDAISGKKASTRPLRNSWHLLAFAILSRRRNHQIPPQLFDSVLSNGLSINSSLVDHSFIRIYHPTSPSATILCRKLSDAALRNFSEWQKKATKKSTRKTFLVAILDAAQLSLDQNRPQEARVLLDCAEQEFPDFLSDHKEFETEKRLELAQEAMLIRKFEVRRTGQMAIPALV